MAVSLEKIKAFAPFPGVCIGNIKRNIMALSWIHHHKLTLPRIKGRQQLSFQWIRGKLYIFYTIKGISDLGTLGSLSPGAIWSSPRSTGDFVSTDAMKWQLPLSKLLFSGLVHQITKKPPNPELQLHYGRCGSERTGGGIWWGFLNLSPYKPYFCLNLHSPIAWH